MAKTTQLRIRLLGDRVLISANNKKAEAKTASGIILPGKEGEEKNEHGVVVAVGPGRYNERSERVPMEVKKGDKVLFKRGYDAEEVSVDGEEYVLLSQSSIIGVEE